MKKKFGFVLAAAILLAGCGQKKETTTTTARPVKTTIVESRSIIRKDFSGIVEAVEYVKLAFRVNGQIIQLPVIEGQKVKKGESFFIPAGLVHAIGKGCLIAEIQQTSDITYRIYDYNRKDANGNTRELHTDLATDVINYSYQPQHRVNYTPQDNQSAKLVKCPYFTTNLLVFDRDIEKEYVHLDSFVIYMCLQGKFTITTGECEPVLVNKGETVLIPACFKNLTLYPDDITQVLEIYVEE